MKLLIEKGAKADAVDDDGRTPLDYAERHGHPDIVQILKIAKESGKGPRKQGTTQRGERDREDGRKCSVEMQDPRD